MIRRQCLGFTLIEVLVALLIIAIACTAVIRSMSQGILVSSHLSESIVSRWVAINILEQLQNGALPSLRENSQQAGVVSMWHRKWDWQANTSSSSSNAYYQQVNVYVFSHNGKRRLYHLTGFVWQPPLQRQVLR